MNNKNDIGDAPALERLRARSLTHVPDLSKHVPQTMPEEEREFWKEISPVLRTIYETAKATRNGPWNMLGTHILQTAAGVAPEVHVADIADKGAISLNINLMSVGRTGRGKTSAINTLRKIAPPGIQIERKPVGTGEGIRDTYGKNVFREDVKLYDVERTAYNCIFDADEISAVAALKNRNGATLLSTMRTMFTADTIGQTNKAENTVIIPKHTYRGCIQINGQPIRIASLMTQEEIDSGTPQRFIYVPVVDEYLDPRKKYDMPSTSLVALHPDLVPDHMNALGMIAAPGHITSQQLNGPTRPPMLEISIPSSLANLVDVYVAANQLDCLDDTRSHEILLLIKLAVGVAWIHGRVEPTEDDVAIAGVIIQKSLETYAEVDKYIKKEKAKTGADNARRTGVQQAVTERAYEETNTRETIARLKAIVNAMEEGETTTRKALAQKLSSRLNPFVDNALRLLEKNGVVQVSEGPRKSTIVTALRAL